MSNILQPAQVDHYVSFKGIDFDGILQSVLNHMVRCKLIAPENPLFAYIESQRNSQKGARRDDLLLLHSLANTVRDLFEAQADATALANLDRLERECF